MKYYYLTILSILLILTNSCGFKGAEEENVSNNSQIQSHNDFDGDLILNEDELNQGTNPYIADLPNLKVRFLQNYKIQVNYKINDPRRTDTSKKEGESPNLPNEEIFNFEIDTKVGRDDPDFKYRVGRIFIRDKAFNDSAKVGQFTDHSWGEIREHDLTWVKYPKVDTSFFGKTVLDYKQIFNKENLVIENIKVNLENSVKLKANSLYKEIKNLELNFYYYDYEKETYELIATKRIDKTFKSGVNELVSVELENLPKNLIEHNYMKKGEFIISEIKDFEIPKLKTTYKRLMASVRARTVPVVFNSPLEQSTYYVGIKGKSESFINILSTIFDKKFTIQDNKLVQINQFKSNLQEYIYLSEIKEEDKKGKWFVFTNKLNKHYLDYSFSSRDIISLSYVLGKELAHQNEEKVFNFKNEISSTSNSAIYPLGNITPNSTVNIQIDPRRIFGTGKIHDHIYFVPQYPPCSGNCIRWDFTCHIDVNKFIDVNQGFFFKNDLSDKFSKISLMVNEEEFSLKKLIDEKKVVLRWRESNVHLIIKDINVIKELETFNENLLSLKLTGITETTYNGFKLTSWHGQHYWQCMRVVINFAGHNKVPLSLQSYDIAKWGPNNVNWNVIEKGHDKIWKQEFSIGLFSLIENNFN